MICIKDTTRDVMAYKVIAIADHIKAGQQVEALNDLQDLSDIIMSNKEFMEVRNVIVR